MKQLNDLIADFWRDYAALVLLAAGLLGVVLLIALGIWAKRSKKPLRPIALAFSMNLALLLNAEGMWVIAIDQLKLPAIFAVLVFAVFEICFLTATSLAAEQYRRTSVYAPDGTIVTPGHPGPMLWIAALIAGLSGVIVASNAVTFTEKLLRLAVPCMIFLMWWAALTAAGQRVRRGRFAYSPRRLAERWGLLIPDDDPDLVRMGADRQVRRMVVNYHRVSAGRFPKSWWRNRLLKDARTAGEPVVEEVIEQLARIQRVMDLLVPGAVRLSVPPRPESLRAAAGSSSHDAALEGAALAGVTSTNAALTGVASGDTALAGAAPVNAASGAAPGGAGAGSAGGVSDRTAAINAAAATSTTAEPTVAPGREPSGGEAVAAGQQAQAVQFVEPVRFVQPAAAAASGPDGVVSDATLPVVRVAAAPGAGDAASAAGFGGVPSGMDRPVAPAAAGSLPGTAAGTPIGAAAVSAGAVQGDPVQGVVASVGPVPGAGVDVVSGARMAADGARAGVDGARAVADGSRVGADGSRVGMDVVNGAGEGSPAAGRPGSPGTGESAFGVREGAGAVGAGANGQMPAVPMQRSGDGVTVPVPVSPASAAAPAAIPAWASTGTGARPAVSIAGSPWWRLAVDRLSKMVAQEISAEDLPEMNYLRINELARKLAPRVSELGEGVVRTFIGEYVRELDGEHVESAYPWRDFLPAPAVAKPGSDAWFAALTDLRTALEEELGEGQPMDPDELSDLLAPSAPRLDERTVRAFIGDYVLALSGMSAAGAGQPWAELMPRPQSARPASDEELLEMHGAELFEHLRSTGRLSRYKVQAVTGIKSRVQADRIKATIEERAAETATA